MPDGSQHFRRYILDSMPVAIVTMDFNFKITSFNRKAEETKKEVMVLAWHRSNP